MLLENYKEDLDLYISKHYVEESINLDEASESMSLEGSSESMSLEEPYESRGSDNDLDKGKFASKIAAGIMSAHFSVPLIRPLKKENILADRDVEVPLAAASASRSLEDVVNNLDKSFMELVFNFADQKCITDVQLQKKANLDRKAFSKLRCGTTKNPSKPTALALAIALELNLDETKDLLSRAGYALSPCSKQDVIVQYFIEREAYDIYEINVALYEHDEKTLGTQV